MEHEHFSTARPTSTSEPATISVALPDGRITLTTDRGVFSHGSLDLGTRVLLLRAPPPPPRGNLLDLGCGTGAIAIALAKRAPAAAVWAVDVNSRAVRLAADNARANGVTRIRSCLPDDVDDDVAFEAIWSNPPIHVGKPALHALLLHWFDRLTPTGTALLVVQKHLGSDSLQAWLGEQGYPTERIASAKGYRVLRSRRGAP